jgi:hypothetical protein
MARDYSFPFMKTTGLICIKESITRHHSEYADLQQVFVLTEEVTMTVLTSVIVIALLATVGTLIWGIVSMAQGGEFDQHHSHQLMFARVGLQGITLLFLLIALFAAVK